jgi:hypothetical protein
MILYRITNINSLNASNDMLIYDKGTTEVHCNAVNCKYTIRNFDYEYSSYPQMLLYIISYYNNKSHN